MGVNRKECDSFDPMTAGFSAFRKGFPTYTSRSVFMNKVEVITDGKGTVIGVTNREKLLFLVLPESADFIQNLEIGKRAFQDCIYLRKAHFSDNLEIVGEEAFHGCRLLEDVVFGNGVYELGAGALEGTALRTFTVPTGVEELPSRLFNDCRSLSSVTLHRKIRRIGSLCFASCRSLSAIDLGFSIEEIPDGCFMGSGLRSISLPHSIKRIGASAFSRCSQLESIYYDGSAEDFRKIDFGMHWNKGIPQDCILYIKDEDGLWQNAFEDKRKKVSQKPSFDNRRDSALKTLGLEDVPPLSELTSIYRRNARRFHPDAISGYDLDQEFIDFAARKFRELTEAYEYLKEEAKEKAKV